MGLRINTNLPALVALRNLGLNDARHQRSLEKLSTGLRINRGADDPGGLALSENLRSQIRGLERATQNATDAGNLINVAESALSEITDLLQDIRGSLLFALNEAAGPEQIAAEQDFINQTIASIRRIAETTRHGEVQLLDGSAGFRIDNVSASGILEVRPIRVRFNPLADPTPFSVTVTASATQATLGVSAVTGGDVVLQVTGPRGTSTLHLGSGTTAAQVAQSINTERGFTGVFGSGTAIYTENFGTDAFLRIEVIGGTGSYGSMTAGNVVYDRGSNAVASFQGNVISGAGQLLHIDHAYFMGDIELQPGASGTFGFEVRRGGLLFQLGGRTTPENQETIGIPSMAPEDLGRAPVNVGGQITGGFLSSISTGGGNDLFSNPDNALHILELALADVQAARTALGAFVSHVVEPAGRNTQISAENLRAADSAIRDADFAEEVAEMTRSQILFQSGVAVLGQTQRIPESVLQLLTG